MPILACHGTFSGPPDAIMLVALALWGTTLLLYLPNLYFVFSTRNSNRFVCFHGSLLAAYSGAWYLILYLADRIVSPPVQVQFTNAALLVVIFGIPAAVISHFTYLFRLRRHLRRAGTLAWWQLPLGEPKPIVRPPPAPLDPLSIAYARLNEGTQLEISGRLKAAAGGYQQVLNDFAGTPAAEDARRALDALQPRLG